MRILLLLLSTSCFAQTKYFVPTKESQVAVFKDTVALKAFGMPSGVSKTAAAAIIIANNRANFYLWDSTCTTSDTLHIHPLTNVIGCWVLGTSPYLTAGNGLKRTGDVFLFDSNYVSLRWATIAGKDSAFTLANAKRVADSTSFATAINGKQSSLGFTPYNSTNPAGYISSVPAQTWASITGKPSFATVATSGLYSDLSGLPAIPSIAGLLSSSTAASTYTTITNSILKVNYTDSGTYYITPYTLSVFKSKMVVDSVAFKSAIGQKLNISDTNVMLSAYYRLAAAAFALALKLNLSDTSAFSRKTRNTPVVTRALNTAFQVSTTSDAIVNYTISMASLVALQTATVSLQVCSTSGGTYVTIAQTALPSLTLLFTLVNQLSGVVPIGYYCKIVSSGTASVSFVCGQENY